MNTKELETLDYKPECVICGDTKQICGELNIISCPNCEPINTECVIKSNKQIIKEINGCIKVIMLLLEQID